MILLKESAGKLIVKISLIFSLALCSLVANSLPADKIQNIADAVDSHYNHLRSLKADFVEIYSGAGSERTESGTLWLKKPGKMRWDYRSPTEKVFVSDGKQAWFFVPGEKQARSISAKQLDDFRSPLAFLLGKSRLRKELKGLTADNQTPLLNSADHLLKGSPIGVEDRINQVVLEITPEYRVCRIVLNGTDGSVTEYRFSNQEENIAAPEQQFHFVPPPGIEVLEGGFTQ